MKHQQLFPQILKFRHAMTGFVLIMIMLLPACQSTPESLELAFPNLSFTRPVDLQHAGDNSDRIFVVEQAGVIKVFPNNEEATNVSVFLDIRERVRDNSNEEGLLGLAFHPNFESNGFFYVNYTASNPRRTVISRFSVSDDPQSGDSSSELVLLEFEQPYGNHNGGQVAFGPDGYLYIATGDGGSAGDPMNNGQNRNTLLGAILRIDVDTSANGRPYGIPSDNPFAGQGDRFKEEIFAYGLRNPWRFSFDAMTGDLWAADVGQNSYEEIDLIVNGGNYGWKLREAAHCFDPRDNCPTENLIDPVMEYGRSSGGSITGGYVYRGTAIPDFYGKYFYADFATGRVWFFSWDGAQATGVTEFTDTNLSISSFGVDQNNELYICAFDGRIYRLGRPE